MNIEGYQLGDPLVETARTRIFRGRAITGESVIVKMPASNNPTARELARYQRAYDLGQLADERAVVRHLGLQRHLATVALVTEDWGAHPLATLVVPQGMALPHFLDLSHTLATAMARLHASGVVHKDVNPRNILVDETATKVRFIDLGAATQNRSEVGDSRALTEVEGTLAYMSPEQCGRIAAMVDDRADLYSLGVTLFELATGRLPFLQTDPQALAHAHVALPPPRIETLRAGFPSTVSDIIETLLNKDAEDRYATAIGLATDLGVCAKALARTGEVPPMVLRQSDLTARFRIPDRLYGRDDHLDRLGSAFDAAGRCRAFVGVSGASGVGKTALINAFQKQVVRKGGRYCGGKFDQFRPDIPYLGVLQALRSLTRSLLTEPDDILDQRRQELLQVLGPFGSLLIRGIPELEAIIGPQPDVDPIPPLDATRRFHRIVARFLSVFAKEDAPLALFIDDLQWADPPTLHLLESLAENTDTRHVLQIAGYRSNEVGPGHPALSTLDRLSKTADVVHTLELGPLTLADVGALVSDTLSVDPSQTGPLVHRLHTISGGNAFFVRELLSALRDRGFFVFDDQRNAWSWNVADLTGEQVPDNLSDLLTARLKGLPEEALNLLDTASCVGSEFDLHTLASVHELAPTQVAHQLTQAVAEALIVPLDTDFKVFEALANLDGDPASLEGLGTVRYRFRHDRVRQTVHERLDEASRNDRHVTIARLLLRNLLPDELERNRVEVFTHVLYGLDQITDRAERTELAKLGFAAGQDAVRSLAFDTAHRLLEGAAALLPADAWTTEYDTARSVHLAIAECAHARGDYRLFEEEAQQVIRHARTPVDAAAAQGLRIRVEATHTRYSQAVDIAIEVAASLGVNMPRKPGLPSVLLGVARTLWAQGRTDALQFAALPDNEDPRIQEAVGVLAQSAGAAYFSEPNLVPLIGMAATRLSLKHGITPTSPYGFAVWALVLCGVLGHIENGGRFGELALEVGRRIGGVQEARARFVVDCFVRHWREPLDDCARLLHESWSANRDAGDEESATYSAGVMLYTHFFAGGALDAHDKYAEAILFLRDCNVPHVKHCFLSWAQLYESLAARELPFDLVGRWYDHKSMLPGFVATENAVQIAISSTAAGILDEFAGRHERATERFELASKYEDGVVGQCLVPGLAFFTALNAYRRALSDPAQRHLLKRARRETKRIRKWARSAPFNLDHRVALLDGYEAMIQTRYGDAVLAFHRVRDTSTNKSLYSALAALGLKAALSRTDNHTVAMEQDRAAEHHFLAWGAPCLGIGALQETSGPTSMHTISGLNLKQLDLQSLLETVAAITSEIDEDALVATLMTTLIESSGADRALLVLQTDQGVVIEVDARLDQPMERRARPLSAKSPLARPALDLARRTGEVVVVHDAAHNTLLRNTPYIEANGVKAILVAPMVLQRRTLGWLYLENHVARGAFTPERVALIEALGSQAAITLENARLYGGMAEALHTQTKLTEANRRFVPEGFLHGLQVESIVDVRLNEAVEREISVLFVDLRGFSAISRRLGPTGTVRMINRYLSHVQPSITGEGGFVGQYYGDGVLALFPGESDSSVRAAISMCRGLEAYNRDRGAFPELAFGMGLHTGLVTLGTIGDPDHFQCSVVGDSVNLASRMEGLTKHFGATLVLSEETRSRMVEPDRLALRSLGRVQVVGRQEVLEVFDCLDCYGTTQRAALEPHLPTFREGVEHYTGGRWKDALATFQALLSEVADPVSLCFADRALHRSQRETDWDGVERPAKGKD